MNKPLQLIGKMPDKQLRYAQILENLTVQDGACKIVSKLNY
jgi:hypothetical protein